jgi:hypothetical protein
MAKYGKKAAQGEAGDARAQAHRAEIAIPQEVGLSSSPAPARGVKTRPRHSEHGKRAARGGLQYWLYTKPVRRSRITVDCIAFKRGRGNRQGTRVAACTACEFSHQLSISGDIP